MRITSRHTVMIAAIALSSAAALSACSSSSDASSASPAASVEASVAATPTPSYSLVPDSSVDLCAAVPASDVESIIGVAPGAQTAAPGTCVYADISLEMAVFPAEQYDAAVKTAKSGDPDVLTIDDITGVGDQAVYMTQKDKNVVFAVQGSYAVVTQGPNLDQTQLSDLANAIFTAVG